MSHLGKFLKQYILPGWYSLSFYLASAVLSVYNTLYSGRLHHTVEKQFFFHLEIKNNLTNAFLKNQNISSSCNNNNNSRGCI